MKKLLLKLIVGLVVLLVAAAVVLYFSLGSIVKKGVETVGPQVTKVSVTLDSAGVSPLTGSGTIKGLVVGNPEGFKTDTAIRLGEASLSVDAMSVFSDKVRVKSVSVVGPEITYETAFKGSNLSKLLENVEASAGAGGGGESGGASKKLQVDELSITGGKIHLSATMLGGQAMTVPLPDIHLKDLGTGEEGITPAELVQKVMKEVTSSATKAVAEPLAKLGKNVGEAAEKAGEAVTDSAKKATEGVKNLFKRK
jgi:hypothetical protein